MARHALSIGRHIAGADDSEGTLRNIFGNRPAHIQTNRRIVDRGEELRVFLFAARDDARASAFGQIEFTGQIHMVFPVDDLVRESLADPLNGGKVARGGAENFRGLAAETEQGGQPRRTDSAHEVQ